ncbi:uncharacterized protein N0V89_003507 [Didymosphaeria variabile]|uniref:Glycosyl transferase CAP10 domain-containing protein n=1 Tax=Didymosphaeria variabile TaxID=1932322 RepID=A0A9W8XQ36_9PLEO|nr:uncharacterized protein N0V89_003507 [Didymosphaeria variabile]KAJ4355491.1 hypothetical protein N0V89_003507 [Didymosphaeria variabile]
MVAQPAISHILQRQVHRGRLLSFLCSFVLIAIAISTYHFWSQTPLPKKIVLTLGTPRHHPIDDLIANATAAFSTLLSKQATTLTKTADAYRKQRGCHPPPGFDAWYAFAIAHNVIIVEDFFDQIYDDLSPFWGVPAKQIRQQARQLPNRVVVRNKKVQTRKGDRKRLDQWIDMVENIQHLLPDLDLPLNMLDEPRVAVPWENISDYTRIGLGKRQLHPAHQVVQRFTSLDIDGETIEFDEPTFSDQSTYWDSVRAGCAPDAPSRNVSAPNNLSVPLIFCAEDENCALSSSPAFTYEGFVSSWTRAKDPCLQPDLLSSHGALIDPLSQSTSQNLLPMFGSGKLSMNNDILLPAFAYWQSTSDYATGNSHGPTWDKKITSVMWRGISSGGRNTPENWTRFHRHRFVTLMNASVIYSLDPLLTTHLPPYSASFSGAANDFELGRWVEAISDVAFTKLQCTIGDDNKDGDECTHLTPYFATQKEVPMKKQFLAKYLPDIDGHGFSGRYLAFLRSTSVPIKATVFSEWHDARLVPWYHFVPMQNSFVDLYGILEYFVGRMGKGGGRDGDGAVVLEGGHDWQARRIAVQGKEWAEKVLRKEDMLVYLLRLLLEYRRVCEDGRDLMGWVGDLVEER